MLSKNLSSVLTPATLGALLSLMLNSNPGLYNPYWFLSLVYFIVFCFCSNLVYNAKAGKSDFTGVLIAGIVIKLLLAFVIVFIFSLAQKAGFFVFAIQFVAHYVLFTIFEIRYLQKLINKSNPA